MSSLLSTLSVSILPLIFALVAIVGLAAYVRFAPPRERAWITRDGKKDRERTRARAMLDEKKAAAREFEMATGMTRTRHFRIVAVAAAIAFISGTLLVGSYGVGVGLAIAAFGFLTRRAGAQVAKLRSGLLADEVVPAARGLANAIASGATLTGAIGDFSRGVPETPLRISLRRALTDPRGLEDGLRAEASRPDQSVTLIEFFELLAEGASTARESAAVAEMLERFAEVSQRQRTSYQAAIRASSEATGTRAIVALLVPVGMAVNFFTSGGANVQSPIGNLLTIASAVLLYISFIVTDRVIRGVLKGF